MLTSSRRYRYWLLLLVVLLILPGIACATGAGLDIISHQLSVRQFTGDLNGTKSIAIVSGQARNISNVSIDNPVIEVNIAGCLESAGFSHNRFGKMNIAQIVIIG